MSYDQPDKSAKFTPSDHPEWVGRLFLFWPEVVDTVNFIRKDGTQDPTDMVTCDVAIIDLPDPENQGKPTFIKDARVGGSALAPQLKKKIGKKVLGRLQQAPRNGEKTGAFFLADFSPQDAQTAEQYETAFPRAAYEAPSGAPAASAWQAAPPPQSGPPAPQGQWGGAQPVPPGGGGTYGPPAASAAPAPPAADAAPPAWGAPAAPAQLADYPGAPGLREFLTARGIDTAALDEAQARQIAATLPQ